MPHISTALMSRERPHRPLEVEDQHHALLVGVVPDLVAIVIVEHDALAELPADGLVGDAHPAILPLLRNDKAEMGAQQALGDASVLRDVVVRGQDREPGRLQFRHAPQQSRRLRAARAVALARHAESEQDEHLPVVAVRNVFLVRRDLVERRQAGAVLQQSIQFAPDLLPVGLDRRNERIVAGIVHRPIGDQALPRHQVGGALDETPPGALHKPTTFLCQCFRERHRDPPPRRLQEVAWRQFAFSVTSLQA
jgi:hypothetical protein